ncbi:MAG: methyltransferase domain-containing protein [Nitrospirae bacterium]|nr:methyltransferase domain-containing protein [Nitrospirota bacterium]
MEKESIERATSNLYTDLWNRFSEDTFVKESFELLSNRIPPTIIEDAVKGKVVLDMGCGSGRYSIALALANAEKVYAIDLYEQSYRLAQRLADSRQLPIIFFEGSFHNLPFEDGSFDFVFCNGTLHHSTSIKQGLREYYRVLRYGGRGFLYLYATGGIFWETRIKMREIFKSIPYEFTKDMLKIMGLPYNRFVFLDTWYVPIETHTSRQELEDTFKELGFKFTKIISANIFDLDYALSENIKDASIMWGEGEHRYILEKG